MFCGECGNEVSDKAVVCPKCGCSVVSSAPVRNSAVSPSTGGSALFTCGYIFAILMPMVGVIIGICSLFKNAGHGFAIIALSLLSWIIWYQVLMSM